MAKDDYYVIAGKILVFLYKRLTGKDKRAVREYIIPLSADFPVSEDYLRYVLEKLQQQGFIEGVIMHRAYGGDIVYFDYDDIRIEPAGIDYMLDNTTLRKVIESMKEAADIISLFIPL